MADGNDRPKSRQPQTPAYAMHPYYYQQYYAAQPMAGTSYVPVVVPSGHQQINQAGYGWPMYPAGYQMVAGAGAMPAYYFPYTHPAYAQYHEQYAAAYQTQLQATSNPSTDNADQQINANASHSASNPLNDSAPIENGSPRIPSGSTSSASSFEDAVSSRVTPTLTRTTSFENAPPIDGMGLVRKSSKGFPKDKSRWRLSRTGSKPSLALDGTGGDDEDVLVLPASPLMGRKPSFSVSPRHCGNDFLPDAEDDLLRPILKPFRSDQLHFCDALRVMARELEMPPGDKLRDRFTILEEASKMKLQVFDVNLSSNEVIGLQNPLNSKICYLNSLIQILFPISPLIQVLSMSLSHGAAGPWTSSIARAFRMVFHPPLGLDASLLTVPGMDSLIRELGGVGTQQDVAEALGTVLDRLHNEWKHVLRKRLWEPNDGNEHTPSHHGLEEDSVVYKLFRGIRKINKQQEIFTGIHLAPPTSGGCKLIDLIKQTFRNELQYLPPVLCIELSRHLSENQLTTSQASIPFSGTMEVPKSCCTEVCNSDRKYQLVGAVVRSGVYANSGHFWAAQRRGDKWYWINDTDVSDCEVSCDDQADSVDGLISKKLDAASNWCVLVYADVDAKIAIHPYL
jgi:ubiquitin C-terminal hydrolase